MMVEMIASRQRSVDKPNLIKYLAADKMVKKQIMFAGALERSGHIELIRDKVITSRTGADEGFRLYKITTKGYKLIQEIIECGAVPEKHFNKVKAVEKMVI